MHDDAWLDQQFEANRERLRAVAYRMLGSRTEADDLDAAIELAARIPAARLGGAIEVRPVATYW